MSNEDYTKYANKSECKTNEENISEPEVKVTATEVTPEIVSAELTKQVETEVITRITGRVFGCSKLNVRCEPDPEAGIICEIDCGTEVEIDEVGSIDDFYKIYTASGVEGYCMKKYILED